MFVSLDLRVAYYRIPASSVLKWRAAAPTCGPSLPTPLKHTCSYLSMLPTGLERFIIYLHSPLSCNCFSKFIFFLTSFLCSLVKVTNPALKLNEVWNRICGYNYPVHTGCRGNDGATETQLQELRPQLRAQAHREPQRLRWVQQLLCIFPVGSLKGRGASQCEPGG